MINAEKVDAEQFPLFAEAAYEECVLSAGEMLYIPPKFWHHVRSLERSFSVRYIFLSLLHCL